MGDFKKLNFWSEAENLVEKVYRATERFPDRERYGLVSQMRRASCSVCANIAEGCGRLGDRELARFARIAAGSATELEALILLAERLRFLDQIATNDLLSRTRHVEKQLYRLNEFLLRRCGSSDARLTTHDS